MPYKVINAFRDAEDDLRTYRKGDTYPVEGKKVSQERLNALLGDKNKQGRAVIQEVKKTPATKDKPATDYPIHTGGGWYELSNGDKIQGKEEAVKAQKEVK